MDTRIQVLLRRLVLFVATLSATLGVPTIVPAAENTGHSANAPARDRPAPIVPPILSTLLSVDKTAHRSDTSGGTGDAYLAGGDADGDGVPDITDVCDNTTAGSAVDSQGRPLGDVDKDCDTDLMDYALLQQGLTGPFPARDFGECNPLTAATSCSKGLNCYVVVSETDPTVCAAEFSGGTQGDACEFLNACASGYSCVLLDDPVSPGGLECALSVIRRAAGARLAQRVPDRPLNALRSTGFIPAFRVFQWKSGCALILRSGASLMRMATACWISATCARTRPPGPW